MPITKEKLTPEATYGVVYMCSAYVKPKQIQEEFGISPQLQHYYCKRYNLPKWQKEYSVRKKESREDFVYDEESQAQRYVEAAGQMLDYHYGIEEYDEFGVWLGPRPEGDIQC